jgi:hypothetical protein
VERYKILHENAYDPVRDVEIDPESGLLQWSEAHSEQRNIPGLRLPRAVASQSGGN